METVVKQVTDIYVPTCGLQIHMPGVPLFHAHEHRPPLLTNVLANVLADAPIVMGAHQPCRPYVMADTP